MVRQANYTWWDKMTEQGILKTNWLWMKYFGQKQEGKCRLTWWKRVCTCKQIELQKLRERPAGELEKDVIPCLSVGGAETGWDWRGRCRKHMRRNARSINTGHANAAPLPPAYGWQSQTFEWHCIQKATDDQCCLMSLWQHRENFPTECLLVVLQADGMPFYRWKVGGLWWCIYSIYFKWVFFVSLLPPDGKATCWDVVGIYLFILKKACLFLQVVLLPEGQAVKLLQGHAEDLLEVLRREVSLKNKTQQKYVNHKCKKATWHTE